MDPLLVLVQFVHIAGGAAWFGGSLFANLVLLPFIGRQAPERQRELIGGVILGPERVMIAAALTAAVTGMLRGIAFEADPPHRCPRDAPWSHLAGIGARCGSRLRHRWPADEPGGAGAPRRRPGLDGGIGRLGPRAARILSRLRLGFRLELLGIAAILALMVLLANA